MYLHILLISVILTEVRGHGRLIEPPSRSSMWRFGFKTAQNVNDNELFCGGFTTQWKKNKGKCGICGDPWHMPQPRENEAGGKYGKGIIVRDYARGQVINATVEITANHKGYFEFKICPTNDPQIIATQKCFDQYPLKVDETSKYKYVLPDFLPRKFVVHLRLPKDLECSHCVFQWTYTSGNNWGRCPGGKNATGCGPQETFRGCADVRISGNDTEQDILPVDSNQIVFEDIKNQSDSIPKKETDPDHNTTESNVSLVVAVSANNVLLAEKPQCDFPKEHINAEHKNPKTAPIVNSSKSSETVAGSHNKLLCKGVGLWKHLPGIETWCVNNCSRGYCPPSHCQCK